MKVHPALVSGCLCVSAVFPAKVGAKGTDRNERTSTHSHERSDRDAIARHAVVPADCGYEAECREQAWRIDFDGEGFVIRPNSARWSWGLELECYGFSGEEIPVASSQCMDVRDNRCEYHWDDFVSEWYVNDRTGFEHGFTLHARAPHASSGLLRLSLQMRGSLKALVNNDGSGLRLLDATGAVALTYSGLAVFDATGRSLDSWFEVDSRSVTIVIEEHDAVYPLTVDPVAQQSYLKASNSEVGDAFGTSVAIFGDTVVVGAKGESSAATGVGGDQLDNSIDNAGAAYVFVRSTTGWVQQAYLKRASSNPVGHFGYSVAIAEDTIVVGAPVDVSTPGAAYVFVRSGSTWTEQSVLQPAQPDLDDRFGAAVAISGETILVGAPQEGSSTAGVNGDATNNSQPLTGAAYVFTRTGTSWSQQAYLKAFDTGPDRFGDSVALFEDTAVVGAADESGGYAGVNANPADDSKPGAGAAYIFQRTGTDWTQEAYLKASNPLPSASFGCSVSIFGDTVAVGSSGEPSAATGINGGQSVLGSTAAGAVYVFLRGASGWSQQAYIKASNTDTMDEFGQTLGLYEDALVVGTSNESSGASGVNCNQADNSVFHSGAAYVFARTGTSWRQVSYVKASNTEAFDHFGGAAAISANVLLVGARGEDSAAQGIDGNQADNSASGSGAVYAFDVDLSTPDDGSLCLGDGGDGLGCTNCPCGNDSPTGAIGGCLNSTSAGTRLHVSGERSVSLPHNSADDLRFSLSQAPPSAFCVLRSGDGIAPTGSTNPCFGLESGSQVATFDGLRCAAGSMQSHGGRSADFSGRVGFTNSPWGGEGAPNAGIAQAQAGAVAGQTRYFQAIHRDDPLSVCQRGLNSSQAIEVTYCP